MQVINTKFGTLFIEKWDFDHHKPWIREEKDKVKIFDSNIEYFDYFSADTIREIAISENKEPQKVLDIIKDKIEQMENIETLCEFLVLDYDFIGTKEQMLKYLNTKDYSILNNERINKIGDYYILIAE